MGFSFSSLAYGIAWGKRTETWIYRLLLKLLFLGSSLYLPPSQFPKRNFVDRTVKWLSDHLETGTYSALELQAQSNGSCTKQSVCGAAGAGGGPDLGFGLPWSGGIPRPHRAAWSQPINRRPKGNKGNVRESGKARERLSLNKSRESLYQ